MFAPQVLAAVMSAVMSAASVPKLFSVALKPLGHVDRSTLESLAKSLETDLRVRVTIVEPEPLPASAFYAPRGRYRAGELVAFLERTTPPGFTHVLGVTAHDISAPKGEVADWGVLGVAKLGGRPGVVSTYRLRAGEVADSVFATRLGRVAAHELAHSLGLPHCATPRCVMNDAGGSIRTVDAATGFCETCARALEQALR